MSSIASRGSESAAAIVSTPTGPPPNLTAMTSEIAPVHLVEPDRVDVEQLERAVGERARHALCAFDHREVAHPPQQTPGDARRAARAPGDLVCAIIGNGDADHSGAARDDALQFFGRVKIEPDRNAETVAQRRGEKTGARRRADQGEAREVDFHRARRGPRADDEVELEILHRRIENFLDGRIEAMNFVDEQDVARFEIGELPREIARFADDRARGRMEIDAELARDDLRQRRLAEARRTDEQHVIERLAARFRGLNEDFEILARGFLAGEIGQELRANRRLVLGTLVGRDEPARSLGHFRPLRPGDEGDPQGNSGRMVRPMRFAANAQTRPAIAAQATKAWPSVTPMGPGDAQSAACAPRLVSDRHLERRADRVEAQEEAIGDQPANESGDKRARRAHRRRGVPQRIEKAGRRGGPNTDNIRCDQSEGVAKQRSDQNHEPDRLGSDGVLKTTKGE